eukprot:scaffold2125_cov126-Cylindrotheca_fusiformis.AAC.10
MMKFIHTLLTFLAATNLGNVVSGQPLGEALGGSDGDYSSLLNAVLISGAGTALNGIGEPITLFAPNNAAFENVSITAADLDVIKGHVVVGEYNSTAVVDAGCVELDTLANDVKIQVAYSEDDGVTVNGISVVEPDIMSDLGIIHGIDGIILPGSYTPCPSSNNTNGTDDKNIFELALEIGGYDILIGAIDNATGAIEAIEDNAPVTVFGPTNASFLALGDDVLDDLAANGTALFEVLAGHIVEGTYNASTVMDAGCVELETLAGTMVKVEYEDANETVLVNSYPVVNADLIGIGGIFHGIEGVILDGSFTPCPTTGPTMDMTTGPTMDMTTGPTTGPTEDGSSAPTPAPNSPTPNGPAPGPTASPDEDSAAAGFLVYSPLIAIGAATALLSF